MNNVWVAFREKSKLSNCPPFNFGKSKPILAKTFLSFWPNHPLRCTTAQKDFTVCCQSPKHAHTQKNCFELQFLVIIFLHAGIQNRFLEKVLSNYSPKMIWSETKCHSRETRTILCTFYNLGSCIFLHCLTTVAPLTVTTTSHWRLKWPWTHEPQVTCLFHKVYLWQASTNFELQLGKKTFEKVWNIFLSVNKAILTVKARPKKKEGWKCIGEFLWNTNRFPANRIYRCSWLACEWFEKGKRKLENQTNSQNGHLRFLSSFPRHSQESSNSQFEGMITSNEHIASTVLKLETCESKNPAWSRKTSRQLNRIPRT